MFIICFDDKSSKLDPNKVHKHAKNHPSILASETSSELSKIVKKIKFASKITGSTLSEYNNAQSLGSQVANTKSQSKQSQQSGGSQTEKGLSELNSKTIKINSDFEDFSFKNTEDEN